MKKQMLFLLFSFGFALFAVAMPSRNELKKVQPTVNELMAEDISAMKSGKQTPEGAAAKAEELAGLATDEASKFLLYKGAFGLYVQGGRYDEAIASLGKLTAAVKDVPDKVLADIVRGKMKKLSKKEGGAIFSYYEQLDRRIRYGEEKEKFAKLVKAEPSNRDARRSLAVALAALGDWKGALAEFVQAGGDEQKAAKAEESGQAASAADLWWTCAGAASDEDVQDVYRVHAAALYRKVIADGKIDGLKKALAEKRIAEACGEVAEARPAVVELGNAGAEKEPEPEKAAPQGEKQDLVVRKCDLHPIRINLKGARPLEFLPIPPGRATVGRWNRDKGVEAQTELVISRPFLMAKLPIDFAQYKAVVGKECYREDWLKRTPPSANFTFVYKTYGKTLAAGLHCAAADEFLVKLGKTFGRQLPPGLVFRYPTLAEYMYAEVGGRPERLDRGHEFWKDILPDNRKWIDEENLRLQTYMAELRKAGAKVPQVDWTKPDSKRALGFDWDGVWDRCLVPTGTKKANPFGLCDLYLSARLLDRLGKDQVPSGDWKDAGNFIQRELDWRQSGTEDHLFWSESKPTLQFRRGRMGAVGAYAGDPTAPTLRIVIGPDLVGERKSKNRK